MRTSRPESQYRTGDEVIATEHHGGLTGRAVRPGDTGVVLGVRVTDDRPVVEWDSGKTRLSSDDSLTPADTTH